MDVQILNTARATTGRVGALIGWNDEGMAAAIATGCVAAGPEGAPTTVGEGAAVREPPSLMQHAPPIEGPSDAQQSSAAIGEQVRQGHSVTTRLNTITARRPR